MYQFVLTSSTSVADIQASSLRSVHRVGLPRVLLRHQPHRCAVRLKSTLRDSDAPIYTGVCLSRATIQFFNHNDMAELRKILESIAKDDKRLKRNTTQQRRWIIVEGVYRNSGNICPLPEVLALKKEFGYRLFLEESYSFGTLGATGRGVTEHFGVSVNEIDILNVSLETALGSVGGVCVGTREVVDHQRLSGAGYVILI